MRFTTLIALLAAVAACTDGSAQTGDGSAQTAMARALETGTQPEGIVARRLAAGDDVYAPWWATFSPDGRYETFTDWRSNELAIRDLETGEIRQVTNTAEAERGYARGGVFSSDGRRIAYGWNAESVVLRTIPTEGGEATTLLDAATRGADAVHPLDWSPDDGSVLAGLVTYEVATGDGFGNAGYELVLISTSDGSVRALKQGPDFRILYGRAFFSPDGRYVAYSAFFGGSPQMGDVRTIEVTSGKETDVLAGPSNDQVLGWSEDGTRLFVVSDRAGSHSIWAIPMQNGARVGDPTLVRRDVHGFASGHVAAGNLYYHVVTETPKLYTMGLDLASGRVLSEPVAEKRGWATWIGHPVWSPDGQYLAYAQGTDRQAIVVRAAAGNHLREFPLPSGFLTVSRLRWTPDSRRLVMGARGTTHSGSSNVLTLTLATGDFAVGYTNPPESWPVSADGRYVYRHWDGTMVRFDLTTGEISPLYPAEAMAEVGCRPGPPALSPSGDHLAFLGAWCVGVMPAEGGAPTLLYRASPGELSRRVIAWTADGKSVLFSKQDPENEERVEVWIVPAAGGEPRKLFGFDQLRWVDVHPDNRRIAFMAGEIQYEMWVMEGLEDVASR
jgi:Tol biopolymer transport system component